MNSQRLIEEERDTRSADAEACELESFTKGRVEVIQRAIREWRNELIDLGGRNNLLNYRDLSRGTLDLTDAASAGLSSLLQGRLIRFRDLYPEDDEREGALRRARVIQRKALE